MAEFRTMASINEICYDYSNKSKIVVTPVNIINPSTPNGKKARTDYLREKKESNDFTCPSKWDDSRHGTGKVGDLFGFVHNSRDLIEIFTVTEKIDSVNRPDYWDIEEHRRRDILVLSAKTSEMKWSTYKRLQGYKENFVLRGTERFNF